jgi:hypothetical protein
MLLKGKGKWHRTGKGLREKERNSGKRKGIQGKGKEFREKERKGRIVGQSY